MIIKEEILKQLASFDIAKGKIVTVHTSLKAIGKIDGGGETLLSALIEFFTQDGGLLCVPTHTWNSTVYDMRENESCIGVLPKIAAGHPDGVRTVHPTHSMTVFGEKNRVMDFVKDEGVVDTPTNPKGCYGKIYDEDGFVLLIGVGHDKNTFLHCVEEMLDVPNRLTKEMVERMIIHKDGREEQRFLHWFDTDEIPDVSVNFGKFEPAFRYHDCIIDEQIGNAKIQLCSARKMKSVVELIYKNNNGRELLNNNLSLDERLYKD